MNVPSVLRAPLWPLEILSGRKTFAGNPILGSERLNRRGLHVWRTRLAHRLAWRRRERLAGLVPAPEREAFARDGFIARHDVLPPDAFAELVAEVERLSARAVEFREGDAVTRQIPLTPAVLARAPALARFVASPAFQDPVRYVGSFDRPPRVYVQTIFSRAGSFVDDPQTALHVDTFHPTVKAWFFLEDVGPDDGPFSYVPGSHLLGPRRLAWARRKSVEACRPGGPKGGAFRLTRADLKRLRLPGPRTFAVPCNTLVVGDTCGVHARTATRRATRRIEIWATSRPNPFWPFANHPWWRVPGVRPLEAVLRLVAIDRLRRLGIDVGASVTGPLSPADPPRLAGGEGPARPRPART